MLLNPAAKDWLALAADSGFEACAAAHLAGLPPDPTWNVHSEWDSLYPPAQRDAWQYLLATYARAERLNQTFACPLERRLRAVFRALVTRRGPGAWEAIQKLFLDAQKAVKAGPIRSLTCSICRTGGRI